MANFCKCGADEYVCQSCGGVKCSMEQKSEWLAVERMGNREGNVCPTCKASRLKALIINAHKRGAGVGQSMIREYIEGR